ncbi:MAG: hypothetical protein NT154_09780 [Verrucomicrobia bacterium]|nr:hypothetical protein [Verrucomicrobiota bacterium]
MLSIICAPASAPQQYVPAQQPWPTPGPRLSDHEHRLLAVVHQGKRQTITVWEAINGVVRDLAPRNRAEARHLRVTLLCSLHRLIRQGRLQRVGHDFVKLVDVPEPVLPPCPLSQPALQPRGRVFEC